MGIKVLERRLAYPVKLIVLALHVYFKKLFYSLKVIYA